MLYAPIHISDSSKEMLCYTFRHLKRIFQINNRFMESFWETERNKAHTSYNSTSRNNTWALRLKFKIIYRADIIQFLTAFGFVFIAVFKYCAL